MGRVVGEIRSGSDAEVYLCRVRFERVTINFGTKRHDMNMTIDVRWRETAKPSSSGNVYAYIYCSASTEVRYPSGCGESQRGKN